MTNAFLKQNLRTLINSHLFCVDNLSDAKIRERLTRDGPPVGYEGQHILGYHWFAYPNAAEGLYSKVFARVNMFGDLVIGSGEETCLVIIRHGRFSVTRQVCDDVANIHDKRLLVCL
jgi:hypothetical protein